MNTIWSKFEQNAEVFIVRFTHKRHPDGNDEITCWLSDLKTLYSETLSSMVDIMTRVKNENRLLLASRIEDKILDAILSLPKKTDHTKVDQINFTRADRSGNHRLQLKYCLSESIPLKFYWTLSKCDENAFYESVTLQLLREIAHMEEKTRDLIEIVKSKDLEIQQYKLDGAMPLTRQQFVTKAFDSGQTKFRRAKLLFDCNVVDLLHSDMVDIVDTVNSNVSAEMSNIGKTDDVPAAPTRMTAKRSEARKLRRHRGYTEEFNGPVNVKYVDSDDQCDDVNNDINVNKSDSSNCIASNNTKATVDTKNADGDALPAKATTKKIRKKLNL